MDAQSWGLSSTLTHKYHTCACSMRTMRNHKKQIIKKKSDFKVLTCHIAKKIRDTQRTRDSM